MDSSSKYVISGNNLRKYNGMGTKATIPEGIKKIKEKAFFGATTIKEVILPEGLTEIEYGAFWGCSNLTKINIPDSVSSFGWNAFSGCSSLTSFTMPNYLTNVTQRLFSGCKSLTSVTVPKILAWIGDGAFGGCEALTEIDLPETVYSLGAYAFSGCKSLVKINIPNLVTKIENGVFENCESLTTLSIPSNVCKIEHGAFRGCRRLTSIALPKKLTLIEGEAFKDCEALTDISIHSGVKEIKYSAFENCKALTSIKIPKTVTRIGENAFKGCTSLRDIYYEGSNEKWAKVDPEKANLPKKATVHTVEPEEVVVNGCVCVEESVKGYNGEGGAVIVPDGIKTIGKEAFAGSKITSITIPDSVNTICSRAFMGCANLENVEMPNCVFYLEDEAFKDCISLKEITLSKSLYTAGKDVFLGCDNLKDVYIAVDKKRWATVGFEIPSNANLHLAEETYEVSDGRTQGGKWVGASVIEPVAKELEGYLLKIEGSDSYSYDNSDDDRAGSYSSTTPFTTYKEINALENSKALIFVNKELKGVMFSVKSGSKYYYYRYYLDGSIKSTIRIGYSASHSSSFIYIEKVTLVKKGENGAPTEASAVKFDLIESDTSI